MNEKRKKYLNIEEKIYKSGSKFGYIIAFTLVFALFMSILNFILFCLVDNYFTIKFLFNGEMRFSDWWNLMWNTYNFPYFKMAFFTIIILLAGVYRSKTLSKEFSK